MVNLPKLEMLPQIDGTVDNDAHYELEIEAHDTCTKDEIVEALEANLYGTLDDEKEEKSELRYLIIQNLTEERLLENENRKVLNYKIAVKKIIRSEKSLKVGTHGTILMN